MKSDDKEQRRIRFSQRLRALRVLSGYSQERLCDVVGVPFGTYIGWENLGRRPRTDNTTDTLYRTLNISSDCLNSSRSLPGNRFWYVYSGGVMADKIKNDEAIKAQLPAMLPPYTEAVKYKLEDGVIIILLPTDTVPYSLQQNVCIVVPDDYISLFDELFDGKFGSIRELEGAGHKIKRIDQLSGYDLVKLPLPEAVITEFQRTFAEMKYSEYKSAYGPWHLGDAMRGIVDEDIASRIIDKYLEKTFVLAEIPPPPAVIKDIKRVIIDRFNRR